MLRITLMSQDTKEAVLRIDGWVSEATVHLLERECSSRAGAAERLVLDLSGVKFIDQAGLSLLHRWTGGRLLLRGASSFVRMLLATDGLESEDVGGNPGEDDGCPDTGCPDTG